MGKRRDEDIEALHNIRQKWLNLAIRLENTSPLLATAYRHCAADLYWQIIAMSAHG